MTLHRARMRTRDAKRTFRASRRRGAESRRSSFLGRRTNAVGPACRRRHRPHPRIRWTPRLREPLQKGLRQRRNYHKPNRLHEQLPTCLVSPAVKPFETIGRSAPLPRPRTNPYCHHCIQSETRYVYSRNCVKGFVQKTTYCRSFDRDLPGGSSPCASPRVAVAPAGVSRRLWRPYSFGSESVFELKLRFLQVAPLVEFSRVKSRHRRSGR